MTQQNYHSEIVIQATPDVAYEKIAQVSEWWAKEVEGNTGKLNDTFTVRFGDIYIVFKIIQAIPGKKFVWLVTDCNLTWIEDTKEWKNTQLVWDISSKNDKTVIHLTHVGLTPDKECYNACKVAWDSYMKKSLVKFIIDGSGLPDSF